MSHRRPPCSTLKAIRSDGTAFNVSGQTASALAALVTAGAAGITSLELSSWALRLAAYVHELRKRGLTIETHREPHPGGWHGRYVLRSAVTFAECGA